MLSEITDGKKFIESAIIYDDKDNGEVFHTKFTYLGILVQDTNDIIENCLNLLNIPDPAQNSLSFPSCKHNSSKIATAGSRCKCQE